MGELLVLLVIVLVVVLLWRGPKTLPALGQALGRGVREARQEASRTADGDRDSTPPDERPRP